MRAVEIIRTKRDGGILTSEQIDAFVRGSVDGTWPDYQLAALLMAIVWRGMNPVETARLTYAIAHSGRTFTWDDIDGPKVDKHSSGGVGDKTTLILTPLAAACGVRVPKMSGRGLGHSGGTLDKLEAIPGFRVDLDPDEFRATLKQVGAVLAGQSKDIAPADKKIYALRDVTATVESIPLLTSSILGKKLAEGLDGLVLDVKYGRGAFMQDIAGARELADSLIAVARENRLPTTVILSAMDTPLGRMVGNALEVREAIEVLHGGGPADLRELSLTLATHMVARAFPGLSIESAGERIETALTSGAGLAKLREMIAAQHGDARVVDDLSRLPTAPSRVRLNVPVDGYLTAMDSYQIGIAAVRLGAGRDRITDVIDPAVGLELLAKPGDFLEAGEPWVEVHYADVKRLEMARALLADCVTQSDQRPASVPIIARVQVS